MTKKWEPRTAATRKLWKAANTKWLVTGHSSKYPVCHSKDIEAAHAAYQAGIVAAQKEKEARVKAAREAYYSGGFKITVQGIPHRVAAHVKNWKARNRAALYQGT